MGALSFLDMARLDSAGKGYELLGKGRRPRSVYARRLTADSAIQKLRTMTVDVSIKVKVQEELRRAGVRVDGDTFDDALAGALRSNRVALFRCFTLNPVGVSRDTGIPMSALLIPEPEAEPQSESSPPPPVAEPAPSGSEQAAKQMASALVEAANTGAALCHDCLDCAACRGE